MEIGTWIAVIAAISGLVFGMIILNGDNRDEHK